MPAGHLQKDEPMTDLPNHISDLVDQNLRDLMDDLATQAAAQPLPSGWHYERRLEHGTDADGLLTIRLIATPTEPPYEDPIEAARRHRTIMQQARDEYEGAAANYRQAVADALEAGVPAQQLADALNVTRDAIYKAART